MRGILRFITDFADGAVMFPLGIAIALTLAIGRDRRLSMAWIAAIGAVWAVMLVLKLAGYTAEAVAPTSLLGELGLVTPSGHVASAAAVYGGLVRLFCGTSKRQTIFTALGIALVVGLSRVVLGEHTLAEVIAGGFVGVTGASAFAGTERTGLGRRTHRAALGVTVFTVVLLHGVHLSWENAIRHLSVAAIRVWQPGS